MRHEQTRRLQLWLKDIITDNGNLRTNASRAVAKHHLYPQDVIAANGSTTVEYRLMVYTTGYLLRLTECLAADFPVLKKFLGDDIFYTFANSAIRSFPSQSYTLTDLGLQFIDFMVQTKPKGTDYNLDLPIAIAKLERMMQEVVRLKGYEDRDLSYTDSLMNTVLSLNELSRMSVSSCLKLMETRFSLKKMFQDLQQASTPEIDYPKEKHTFIAVSRKNYRIMVEEIPDWHYYFFHALVRGKTIHDALIESADKTGRNHNELFPNFYFLLPVFLEKGFLVNEGQT